MSFNQGPIDVGRVAQVRYTQSAIFDSFKKWLGNSAPIVTHVEQQALANTTSPDKQAIKSEPAKATPRTDFLGKTIEKAPTNNPMTNYVNQTWGPSSKK